MASHIPTFAPNSSAIQPGRTGVTGSASAAGGSVAAGVLMISSKALHLPPVGGDGGDLARLVKGLVVGEPLGQLAGLGVPQPYPVARLEISRRFSPDRGLDLTGPFGGGELEARR